MNALTAGAIVFMCTFSGALLGMWLRKILPRRFFDEHHRDSIKLSVGVIASITALVLGLVTASAKTSFDAENSVIKQGAINVLYLDRTLLRYGPETNKIRQELREIVSTRSDVNQWSQMVLNARSTNELTRTESIVSDIAQLKPHTDEQSALKTKALDLAEAITQLRWLALKDANSAIPVAFLFLLMAWLTFTFTSFGMLAIGNILLVIVYFFCSLSVASAIFILIEMETPFSGVMKVSLTPVIETLQRMDAAQAKP